MTREQSHKGSGHPRKKQETQEGRNDRRQNDGSGQQIINEEEEREGMNLDEKRPEQQGERGAGVNTMNPQEQGERGANESTQRNAGQQRIDKESQQMPRTEDETSAGH